MTETNRRDFMKEIALGGAAMISVRGPAQAAQGVAPEPQTKDFKDIYLVTGMHPGGLGYQTDCSVDLNYSAYSYLDHLDRVRDDRNYNFVFSMVTTLMAIKQLEPERYTELTQRIKEGRVELVAANFIEPATTQSGGEPLVQVGVQGLRWQEEVMGVRPRLFYVPDNCGFDEQFAQIVSGLGLEGIVHAYDNRYESPVYWFESPDGTRCLGLSPSFYVDQVWNSVFLTPKPLEEAGLQKLWVDAREKASRTPAGFPVLVMVGGIIDYSLAPLYPQYPSEFLEQWKQFKPEVNVQVTTFGKYLEQVLPAIRAGKVDLPVVRYGTKFTFNAFWIQNLPVRLGHRHAEYVTESAEALAAAASLTADFAYPVQQLYKTWMMMVLVTERATLWGVASGSTFESRRSWDAKDRFNWIETSAAQISRDASRAILGSGNGVGVYNPVNWRRNDPARLRLPAGYRVVGALCQAEPDGRTLYRLDLPGMSMSGLELEQRPPEPPRPLTLPSPPDSGGAFNPWRPLVRDITTFETAYYSATVNSPSGMLSSLKLKPSGKEMLSGPMLLVAEENTTGGLCDCQAFAARPRLADSSEYQYPSETTASEGPLAITVTTRSTFFGGGRSIRTIHFYKDHPRIDFDVEVNDVPDRTVVAVEVPLAELVQEMRRGLPFGFSHAAVAAPRSDLFGLKDGLLPTVRWSHYQLSDRGLAILDYGMTGRELTGQIAQLFMLNCQDKFVCSAGGPWPQAWTSGKGTSRASFALVAHHGDFQQTRIPQMARELNYPPLCVAGMGCKVGRPYLETSANLIVEACRREGKFIEVRLSECMGQPGTAEVTLNLPHQQAFLTDMMGERAQPLEGGPKYRVHVRSQQVLTLRFETDNFLEASQPVLAWDEFVPSQKLPAQRKRMPDCKGHPLIFHDETVPILPEDSGESLTLLQKVTASSVDRNLTKYDPEFAVDEDAGTFWASDRTDRSPWLEVDLGKPETIGRAWIAEGWGHVRKWELQYLTAGQWQTCARGEAIGHSLGLTFPAVTAQRVRLNLTETDGGSVCIWEFHLYKYEAWREEKRLNRPANRGVPNGDGIVP